MHVSDSFTSLRRISLPNTFLSVSSLSSQCIKGALGLGNQMIQQVDWTGYGLDIQFLAQYHRKL